MAQFAFIGDGREVSVYGLRFPLDVPVEVTEPAVIAKLRHMRYPSGAPYFVEAFDGVQVMDAEPSIEPKRRGRPPKAK